MVWRSSMVVVVHQATADLAGKTLVCAHSLTSLGSTDHQKINVLV
jgi:hypothetical protein